MLRHVALVIGVLWSCVPLMAADSQPSGKIDWSKPPKAQGYANATAWTPHFDDGAVWPLSGKERFLKQQWPKGQLIVWAKPGETADAKKRGNSLDAYDVKNWIDPATGKAPDKVLGEDCDILLPASGTPYTVSFAKADVEHAPVTVRHITVEPGARWRSAGLLAHGSIWVKAGGQIGNHGSLALLGDKDTFFRNDNGDPGSATRSAGSDVSQYITFNKPKASAEFFGAFSTGDEFRVFAGTLVVGPDTRVQPGRNASPFVEKEATLALMDGAAFGKWVNQIAVIDLTLLGTLQGGLPERPLTRDAKLGISYQNINGTKFYDNGLLADPRGRGLECRMAPLLVGEGATIRTYSADPKTVSLVIGWVGLDAKQWHANPNDIAFKRMAPEAQKYLSQQLDKLPRGVTAAFAGNVQVDGVRFDEFAKGGILMVAPSGMSAWKNVTYGQHNQGTPGELRRKVSKIDFRTAMYQD